MSVIDPMRTSSAPIRCEAQSLLPMAATIARSVLFTSLRFPDLSLR